MERAEIEVVEEVAARLRKNPLVRLEEPPILAFEDGVLEVEGAAPDVRTKRRVIRSVTAVPGVARVVDRLRVRPTEPMGDGEVADHVTDAIAEDPVFAECTIRKRVRGDVRTVRDATGARGDLTVAVEDGIVALEGEMPTRAHARLAAVLAWWVPGTQNVVDRLRVASEDDNDEELIDSIRTVFEKDPFIDASELRVQALSGVVTLTGVAANAAQREIAEHDAFFVPGVVDVINTVEVRVA